MQFIKILKHIGDILRQLVERYCESILESCLGHWPKHAGILNIKGRRIHPSSLWVEKRHSFPHLARRSSPSSISPKRVKLASANMGSLATSKWPAAFRNPGFENDDA